MTHYFTWTFLHKNNYWITFKQVIIYKKLLPQHYTWLTSLRYAGITLRGYPLDFQLDLSFAQLSVKNYLNPTFLFKNRAIESTPGICWELVFVAAFDKYYRLACKVKSNIHIYKTYTCIVSTYIHKLNYTHHSFIFYLFILLLEPLSFYFESCE